MRFYIIDDEIGTVMTLCNIIEDQNLGEIAGQSTDPIKASEEILRICPDIVLVDLLMDKLDGIALVGQIKAIEPGINFVMLSQVNDKDMVASAYKRGVEFFINKPINVIEVVNVIKNVSEKIKMNSIVSNIKGLFSDDSKAQAVDPVHNISRLLGYFGMTGERGTGDILEICRKILSSKRGYSKEIVEEVAREKEDTPKNVEQRIRRAIKKGLTNVANIALEDYSNEIFQEYANYVFDFRNIREEMDYIKGISFGGGRINITKFIEGLLLYNKSLIG